MAESRYWNPRRETLPRDQLEALQLRKLRSVLAWAQAKVPYQARRLQQAGVTPESIRTLDDLRRIPLFTRDEWMEGLESDPPFGPLSAVPPDLAIRYHTTSGTTGRQPIRALDGMKDWEWIAEMWCYGFWAAGIRPSDRVFIAFSYGGFIGFWGAHYAAEKIGCMCLPSGGMTTERRVQYLVEMGATVVCTTPTYGLRMAQEAQKLGINLAESPVRLLLLSGEPGGSLPATQRLMSEQWGAEVCDTAGMTEVGTIVMFECDGHPGGMHTIDDHYIEEVVDPKTGEPVGYGEIGERVVTSFGRGFIPVIRYRTGDLVRRVPASTCTCGRTFDIYEGGIIGRVDDMKVVRGTNVYPSSVEAIVREFREVDEFQIYLYTDGIRDEIEVRIELPDPAADEVAITSALSRALQNAHGGLNFRVRRVESGSLPRFELKARRLVDERRVVGSADERKAL